MPIIVNLDVMMAKRKMSSGELAERVGITPVNLSVLKTGKARAIRFTTLEAICQALDCQPGRHPGVSERRINALGVVSQSGLAHNRQIQPDRDETLVASSNQLASH